MRAAAARGRALRVVGGGAEEETTLVGEPGGGLRSRQVATAPKEQQAACSARWPSPDRPSSAASTACTSHSRPLCRPSTTRMTCDSQAQQDGRWLSAKWTQHSEFTQSRLSTCRPLVCCPLTHADPPCRGAPPAWLAPQASRPLKKYGRDREGEGSMCRAGCERPCVMGRELLHPAGAERPC